MNIYIYVVDIQSGSHIDGVGDLYDAYPEMVKDIFRGKGFYDYDGKRMWKEIKQNIYFDENCGNYVFDSCASKVVHAIFIPYYNNSQDEIIEYCYKKNSDVYIYFTLRLIEIKPFTENNFREVRDKFHAEYNYEDIKRKLEERST